jgi:hypothetical protein
MFINFFKWQMHQLEGTRSLKLVKHGCNLDIKKFSFSHRIVNTYSQLSDDI